MNGKYKIFIIIGVVVTIGLIFVLGMMLNKKQANIENIKITIGNSTIYSNNEIELAIDIVLEKLKKFPAVINEIVYDEEKSKVDSHAAARQYNTDDIIVLYSNFTTYPNVEFMFQASPLNANSDYKDWKWILVRNTNGEWEVKSHGY